MTPVINMTYVVIECCSVVHVIFYSNLTLLAQSDVTRRVYTVEMLKGDHRNCILLKRTVADSAVRGVSIPGFTEI